MYPSFPAVIQVYSSADLTEVFACHCVLSGFNLMIDIPADDLLWLWRCMRSTSLWSAWRLARVLITWPDSRSGDRTCDQEVLKGPAAPRTMWTASIAPLQDLPHHYAFKVHLHEVCDYEDIHRCMTLWWLYYSAMVPILLHCNLCITLWNEILSLGKYFDRFVFD